MKPSITLNFETVSEMTDFLERIGATGNVSAASPVPAGQPAPPPTAPQPGPAPAPAPTQAPPPPPQQAAPLPPPAGGNGADSTPTVQDVMKAMAEYAKVHKAAGVRNIMSHVKIGKVTEANPAQLVWLKATFDANQPVAPAA